MLEQGKTEELAKLLGVPEDKVVSALAEVEKSPEKLTQLGELLGVTTPQEPAVVSAGLPAEEGTPAGVVVPTPAAGQVTSQPSMLTNLFARAGLDESITNPLASVASAVTAGAVTGESTAGADRPFGAAEFVETIARAQGAPAEADPVTEA
ncbi:hypothetical protein [Nocardia crassostreae]|uniref:hypothetical protein n=1 Tax=Nocardia crassostreae TaxID=53428 RepID=UPI00082CE9B7|nr:hypothetical protein [Nocardia crassostreae]